MSNAAQPIAVLFARKDSIYKSLPGCDVWDEDRDARKWPGGVPAIAHPPCRAWGRLAHFANPRDGERELALEAVERIRANGGVLEHPAFSMLWPAAGLPRAGRFDSAGGWTLPVLQFWWGHRALKATFLYIVGCTPDDMPPLPLRIGHATHVITTSRATRKAIPECTKAERERTPPAFAEWLCEVARRCRRSA